MMRPHQYLPLRTHANPEILPRPGRPARSTIFERVQKFLDNGLPQAHDLNMFKGSGDNDRRDARRSALVFLILAMAAGSLLHRISVFGQLDQTAVLFIGMPALIALIVALTPKAKSATGSIMKGITLVLLIAGPLLGEGFICILMAAPIFYLVGLLIGFVTDSDRRRRNTRMLSVAFLAPMVFEGVSPRLSFHREETVQAQQVIAASASDVERALARSPRVDLAIPAFGRIGFPLPERANGIGLEFGATRVIAFAGMGHPEYLIMRVEDSRPGYLRFATVSDESMIAHWLAWKSAEVEWTAVDAGHTRVTWTLHFRRLLDPAWYFRPWERYAAGLAADYLIQANAVPTAAERMN